MQKENTMYDLSILIPARNEQFLRQTVDDIMRNIRGNTEVIVVLDGAWSDPPLADHDRLTIIYNHESVGQRAATNQAARISKAKYVMKVDAHCAFDEGFDVKMVSQMQDDYTMVPVMYNLHCFDWKCAGVTPLTGCGNRIYQGPTPEKCEKCGGLMMKDMVWKPRLNKRSECYRFDTTLHFMYHGERKKQVDPSDVLVETMSLQGSCFMLTRAKYWELNICDENFGSWGQQGTEVACKTWLSGGKVMVNRNTWYSHMFRTQGGDFGFPYPLSGRQVEKARKYSRELFMDNTWDKQIYPLSWLLEKFKPLPDWHEESGKKVLEQVMKKGEEMTRGLSQHISTNMSEKPTKSIMFFTDNQLNLKIAHKVQKQLSSIGLPIVSVSLKPMPHFGTNIHIPLQRGVMTYFTQILAGLEASTADIIYFCEHDVIYHPSHFDFTPDRDDRFYYNQNFWKVRLSDNFAVHWDANQVSGLVADRKFLLEYYRNRIKEIESKGFNRSYEPGGRNSALAVTWNSKYPNIDIRHEGTLTGNKWSIKDFRDKSTCVNWQQSTLDKIPGWNFKGHII